MITFPHRFARRRFASRIVPPPTKPANRLLREFWLLAVSCGWMPLGPRGARPQARLRPTLSAVARSLRSLGRATADRVPSRRRSARVAIAAENPPWRYRKRGFSVPGPVRASRRGGYPQQTARRPNFGFDAENCVTTWHPCPQQLSAPPTLPCVPPCLRPFSDPLLRFVVTSLRRFPDTHPHNPPENHNPPS